MLTTAGAARRTAAASECGSSTAGAFRAAVSVVAGAVAAAPRLGAAGAERGICRGARCAHQQFRPQNTTRKVSASPPMLLRQKHKGGSEFLRLMRLPRYRHQDVYNATLPGTIVCLV